MVVLIQQSWLQAHQFNFCIWLYMAASAFTALSFLQDLHKRTVLLSWFALGILQCSIALGYWGRSADVGSSFFLGPRRALVPSAMYVASGCNLLLMLVLFQVLNRLTVAVRGSQLKISPKLRIAFDQYKPEPKGKEWDVVCSLILTATATMSGAVLAFLFEG
jgi:hypothetical protein